MKKYLALILILPALGFAQFGHGGGGASVSQMMAVYADSSAAHGWTAGSNINRIKPRGGKSLQADSLFVDYAAFTSNVILNTVAGEQLTLGTGSNAAPELSSVGDPDTGIRFPGSDITTFVQGGAEKFRVGPNGINVGATTTPKAKLQVSATGMSAADYYKGIRLSNSDVATFGVQAFSPAFVLAGAAWNTITSTSDSTFFAIYQAPSQGTTSSLTPKLMIDYQIGNGGWVNLISIAKTVTTIPATNLSISSGGIDITRSSSNTVLTATQNGSGKIMSLFDGATEVITVSDGGNLGLGTATPQAKLSVVGADGTGTGLHVVSSDLNLRRDSWAQVTDTSSVSIRLDASGNPVNEFVNALGNAWKLEVGADNKLSFYYKDAGSWIKKASIDTTGAYTDEY